MAESLLTTKLRDIFTEFFCYIFRPTNQISIMFWESRHNSKKFLNSSLKESKYLLEECFAIIDECLDVHSNNSKDEFCHIIGLTLAKAKSYGHAMYSLALDGLAQEGSCIMRNLHEAFELMAYLNQDPSRIEKIKNGKKPVAGKIAQKINGELKFLRDYLNDHSSHFYYSKDTLSHLIEVEGRNSHSFKKYLTVSENTLKKNLKILNAFLNLVCMEAINSLRVKNFENTEITNRFITYHDRFGEFYDSPM